VIPALEIATSTDCGRVRSQNEDCLEASAAAGIAVLADGMGGHNAGEVASEMAVRLTTNSLLRGCEENRGAGVRSAESLLASAIQHANVEIFRAAEQERAYRGMGTTIVAALWHDGSVSVAHVGDSRAYRLRGGRLHPLTRDHTVVQEHVDAGLLTPTQARSAPDRHVLTRAVGTELTLVVDVETHDVLPDDVYVLCSDGVHDMLNDRAIEDVVAANAAAVSSAAHLLIERANAAGGLDNASTIVVRVVALPRAEGA
jgi:protein phosphatase